MSVPHLVIPPFSTVMFDDDTAIMVFEASQWKNDVLSIKSPKPEHNQGSEEISFSAVPLDFEICEKRFKKDANYRDAVSKMFNICKDGVDEDAFKVDAEYRAAVAVVVSPCVGIGLKQPSAEKSAPVFFS